MREQHGMHLVERGGRALPALRGGANRRAAGCLRRTTGNATDGSRSPFERRLHGLPRRAPDHLLKLGGEVGDEGADVVCVDAPKALIG